MPPDIRAGIDDNSPVCRVCLLYNEDESLEDMFIKNSRGFVAKEAIEELFLKKVVRGARYPKFICTECVDKLTDLIKFRDLYLHSTDFLENQVSALNDSSNINTISRPLLIGEEDEEKTSPSLTTTSITKTCQDIPSMSVDTPATIIKHEAVLEEDESFTLKLEEDEDNCIEEINPSQQGKSEIILGHVNKEKCMSPGVLSADFKVNHKSNPVEQSSEKFKPYKCLECSMEFSKNCNYTHHSRAHKYVNSSSSEQNHESTRSTDLEQKEFDRVAPNINLLQNERNRTLGLESESCEFNGTTSVQLFRTVTSSTWDKSNEDGIEFVQQGDSLIASEFQSGGMMTMEERHSFEEEEGYDVGRKLRNSDVKKGKDDVGDGIFSHYNCDHCSKVFNDIRSLNMHLSLHKRDFTIEGKEVTSMNVKVTKNTNKNIGKIFYNCEVCSKSYKRKFNLKVHMRIHSGKKPYGCSVCHQMFNHKGNRDKHMVHIHESYRCSYCNKSFPVKDKLAEHVQECRIKRVFHCNWCNKCFDNYLSRNEHLRTHMTEGVFKCHYCDKCFSRRGALSVHERIHTGEKPFICSVCGKSFSQQSYSNVHMRMHTNDKRYKCGYCNKAFIQNSNLRVHERTHTKDKPFRCSYCDKSFSDQGNFKRHERIHRGEKEFGCSFCRKRFSQRSRLKQHEKIHLKIKSFECNICKKSFDRNSSLRMHMKVHIK